MGKTDLGPTERYALVMRRANGAVAISAFAIYVLAALSVAPDLRAMAWVGAICLLILPFNLAINHFLVRTGGVVATEWSRLAVNICGAVAMGHAIDWRLPAWLWLPFCSVAFDGYLLRTHWLTLSVFCLAVDGAALHEGASWIFPLSMTTIALAVRLISERRLGVVRDMVEESDRQCRALDEAHTCLTRAVAKRQEVELELRHAQKLEAVGRLASGVAHEINTPLQFVMNSIEFIGGGVEDLLRFADRARAAVEATPLAAELDEAAKEASLDLMRAELPDALQMSTEGLSRVASLVASLKEFAHPEETTTSKVDLNHAINTTLIVAKHEYKYVADIETQLGDIPFVECHLGDLNQVLLNLFVNAAHAITEGGKGRGHITVRTTRAGDEVVVAVADDGCGIRDDVRERIFEPFFTTKSVGKGTGQGLAISRAIIVERLGGSLVFESTAGVGTTFFIRLPVGVSRSSTADRRAA